MSNQQAHEFVKQDLQEGVLVIQLNHPNIHNPFNKALEQAVIQSLSDANKNDEVRAIVLTGGAGKSFSAGGDFNEVKLLKGGDEVDAWIDGVISLYVTSLQITKPTVALVDGFAIGIGFQLAMTFDWRIGTHKTKFVMPELKHGISCTIGACMLERMLGRANMMKIIFGCDEVSAEEATAMHLLNEIVEPENSLNVAIEKARVLATYPQTAYKNTKISANKAFINDLYQVAEGSKLAHRASFKDGALQQHFNNILGDKSK